MLAVLPELGRLLGWRQQASPSISSHEETACLK
jgi:hypothetical protein